MKWLIIFVIILLILGVISFEQIIEFLLGLVQLIVEVFV